MADMCNEDLVDEVIRAVAAHANTRPEELPPLSAIVDPDALEAVFGPRLDGTPRQTRGRVEFRYAGHQVVVTADGEVAVDPEPDGD